MVTSFLFRFRSKPSQLNLGLIFLIFSMLGGCTKDSSTSPSTPSAPAGEASAIGVGPISHVDIGSTIDSAMASKGKQTFEAKCVACHKFETKYVGPALIGVTKRRKPEWIMNMILNPMEMTQKDETAKALLAEHLTQMANQNVSQEDARAIVEYFRQKDSAQKN